MVTIDWFLMSKIISYVKTAEALKIQNNNPATEQILGKYEAVTEEQTHAEVRNSRYAHEDCIKNYFKIKTK